MRGRADPGIIEEVMFGDLQQWLVLLVMLVPGFIVTSIQRGFRPRRFATQFDWFASSILYSIYLNAVVFIFWLLAVPDGQALTIDGVSKQFGSLKITWLLWYLAALYIIAVIWGAITGRWQTIGFRAIANRLGITQYGEHGSVWARVFDRQVPARKGAIWLKICLEGGTTIFGKLRHSSARVEQDKPIEVYISPYYELTNEGWKRASLPKGDEISDGIYLKIINEHSVEFFFKDRDWTFSEGDKT